MILVPAVMSLLGHRAWWLPDRLERALPSMAIDTTMPSEAQTDQPVGADEVRDRIPTPA
jgi:RND superfamily putative drug exporter